MYKRKSSSRVMNYGIYQRVRRAAPPDAARNQMLLSCYFSPGLNAAFKTECYIAAENGRERPNFGGDFSCVQSCEKAAACEYTHDFQAGMASHTEPRRRHCDRSFKKRSKGHFLAEITLRNNPCSFSFSKKGLPIGRPN